MRDRRVRLRGAQAIAGALELGARLLGQAPRALRRALGVLDPAEQQQALPAAERLIERREVALAALRWSPRAARSRRAGTRSHPRPLRTAPGRARCRALRSRERALAPARAPRPSCPARSRGGRAGAGSARRSRRRPRSSKRVRASSASVLASASAPDVAQRLRLPAVLERQRAPGAACPSSSSRSASVASGSRAPFQLLLQEVEQQQRRGSCVARLRSGS